MSRVPAIGTPAAPPPPKPPAADAQLQKLREVAQEFEALFINTLLRAMRETVMEADLFNPQGDTKYYRQLHDEELSRVMARQDHGLGVADLIVNQYAMRLRAEKAYGTEMASESPSPSLAITTGETLQSKRGSQHHDTNFSAKATESR